VTQVHDAVVQCRGGFGDIRSWTEHDPHVSRVGEWGSVRELGEVR